MKFGYACQNISLKYSTNHTFRLASYNEEKLTATVRHNIKDLEAILQWNLENGFLFFRIGSQMIPFASHPVCNFDWENHFQKDLARIGKFIQKNSIRISMHPDQFVIINAKDPDIIKRSIAELDYHCRLLDAMKLPASAKVQIHVGGVYGNRRDSIDRFIRCYLDLPKGIRRRLVIENDDRSYSVRDCLQIHEKTGIPVIFDNLHHQCLNNGEKMTAALLSCMKTWKKSDGSPMVDYSEQMPGARIGNHIDHVDLWKYRRYRAATKHLDFDMMLEIKDKEKSALLIKKVIEQ